MHNYKELKIWQKSRILVKDVYQLTNSFPKEESYGLTSQIRRAVISIPANIAEGAGRGTNKDFSHFLDISMGSLFELESLLILSIDLSYLTNNKILSLVDQITEVGKMIVSFKSNLSKI